ncbi:MAG: hypothetical protein LBQ12_13420 [Deltaproteobacteria bacterium]|jgi:hypothetical protein|nr:hypothetical protein [Deltaproteobacteria bacterium]
MIVSKAKPLKLLDKMYPFSGGETKCFQKTVRKPEAKGRARKKVSRKKISGKPGMYFAGS